LYDTNKALRKGRNAYVPPSSALLGEWPVLVLNIHGENELSIGH